jgi:hypothetical protein
MIFTIIWPEHEVGFKEKTGIQLFIAMLQRQGTSQ